MYSPRLCKYRDSYVLYKPTVHAFGSLLLTHTLLVQSYMTFPPPDYYRVLRINGLILELVLYGFLSSPGNPCIGSS